jgi:hypothetical protein
MFLCTPSSTSIKFIGRKYLVLEEKTELYSLYIGGVKELEAGKLAAYLLNCLYRVQEFWVDIDVDLFKFLTILSELCPCDLPVPTVEAFVHSILSKSSELKQNFFCCNLFIIKSESFKDLITAVKTNCP